MTFNERLVGNAEVRIYGVLRRTVMLWIGGI